MRIDFLAEPELEFGSGRHIDIRFGIMNYGPHDVDSALAPRRIRVGIVGTPEDVERVTEFLERCRNDIEGATSRQSNLRPRFPGFRADSAFYATLILDESLRRTIPAKFFEDLWRCGDANQIIREATSAYVAHFAHLLEHSPVDVLLCAVPQRIDDLRNPALRPAISQGEPRLDFRHYLKARAMLLSETKPVQLILPSTSDPSRARKSKIKNITRKIQDDATRAWNLHTALYYKARGRPWRIPRDLKELTTCFVGVSFYYDLQRTTVLTSMAQVFDERGDGVVVRGGPVQLSRDDRTPHLSTGEATALLLNALQSYRATHETLPARVVLHKTSAFDGAELEGFRAAAAAQRVSRLDAVSVSDRDGARILRYGAYPPLRGTWLALDERQHLLYTRGSVDFYATYPGMYIPQPLLFRCDDVEVTPKQIARELLALSKLNWNQTQFDGSEPITVVAARSVGDILKYVGEDERIAPRFSFYM
jgi:hypothetical protein